MGRREHRDAGRTQQQQQGLPQVNQGPQLRAAKPSGPMLTPQQQMDEQRQTRLEQFRAWLPITHDTWMQYTPPYQGNERPAVQSVDWLPGWHNVEDGWGDQQLLLGFRAVEEHKHAVQVLQLRLPVRPTDLHDSSSDSPRHQPTLSSIPRHHKIAWIYETGLQGDVDRLLHMPQHPRLIAVKSMGYGLVLLNINSAMVPDRELVDGHAGSGVGGAAAEEEGAARGSGGHSGDGMEGVEDEEEAGRGAEEEEGNQQEYKESSEDGLVGLLGAEGHSDGAAMPLPDGFGLAWNPTQPGVLLSTCEKGEIHMITLDAASTVARAACPVDEAEPCLGHSQLFSGAHPAGVNDVAWACAGGPLSPGVFASVGEQGELVGWDVRAPGHVLRRQGIHQGAANSLDFSSSDPYAIVTGGLDGRMVVLDLRGGRDVTSNGGAGTSNGHSAGVVAEVMGRAPGTAYDQQASIQQIACSPLHAGWVASSDEDGRVLMWNLRHPESAKGWFNPPQLRFTHAGHASSVESLSWSLCEGPPLLASCSHNWSPKDWEEEAPVQDSAVQVWSPAWDVLHSGPGRPGAGKHSLFTSAGLDD